MAADQIHKRFIYKFGEIDLCSAILLAISAICKSCPLLNWDTKESFYTPPLQMREMSESWALV